MHINKAIEILTLLERTLAPTMAADGTDAIKLGIEALKRCRTLAQESTLWKQHPLPGETKE